jgi:hypothetical protein
MPFSLNTKSFCPTLKHTTNTHYTNEKDSLIIYHTLLHDGLRVGQ